MGIADRLVYLAVNPCKLLPHQFRKYKTSRQRPTYIVGITHHIIIVIWFNAAPQKNVDCNYNDS